MITMPDRLENNEFWCSDCENFLTENQVAIEPDNGANPGGLKFLNFCKECATLVTENVKIHIFNERGMEHIRLSLVEQCNPGAFLDELDEPVVAGREPCETLCEWASRLEEMLQSGNGNEVEIPAHLTKTGQIGWLSAPTDGIEIEYEDPEDFSS